MQGKVALVTGANRGLGLAICRALYQRGAHVIMVCRDPHRGERSLARLAAEPGQGSLQLQHLDLADRDGIDAAVRKISAAPGARVDLLVNNAGILHADQAPAAPSTTPPQMTINHLGHFALTLALLPLLQNAPAARVISVTSPLQRWAAVPFTPTRSQWQAYAQSKLANLLFATTLQRRCGEAGLGISAIAAHPGYVATQLQAKVPLAQLGNWLLGQSPAHASRTLLAAIDAVATPHDQFWAPSGWLHLRGQPALYPVHGLAADTDVAAQVWRTSEQLTGYSWQQSLGRLKTSAGGPAKVGAGRQYDIST